MEAILIPLGTIIFYNLEGNNPETLGGLSTMEKWQSAVLMSVSSDWADLLFLIYIPCLIKLSFWL